MANAFYTKGKEKILSAEINFSTGTIKAALVKDTYPQNLATDEFYTKIAPYVLNTPQTIGSKTITGGVFDGSDVSYLSVTAGDVSKGVVIYKDTGDLATSPLLCYIDTITGFPITTNGGDIIVRWDNGANKIFSL